MPINQIECFGGPMDGKFMPIPEAPQDETCLVSVGPDGQTYFYVMNSVDGTTVLEYAGTRPHDVVHRLREMGSPYAEELQEQLDALCSEADGEDTEDD